MTSALMALIAVLVAGFLLRAPIGFSMIASGVAYLAYVNAERIYADLAAMVRAVQGQQTRLQRDEADGVAGPHGAAQGSAALGVETAGNIQRQQRAVE